jgi:hypothetical protein
MPSSGMLRCVALVRTHVTEERRFLHKPHSVTCQKTALFIVTAVKTSNLTQQHFRSWICFNLQMRIGEKPTLMGSLEMAGLSHYLFVHRESVVHWIPINNFSTLTPSAAEFLTVMFFFLFLFNIHQEKFSHQCLENMNLSFTWIQHLCIEINWTLRNVHKHRIFVFM